MTQSIFKPQAPFEPGFIANTKDGELSTCRFGGDSWSVIGTRPDLGQPALLVTVDLNALRLSQPLGLARGLEIPLFSYINIAGMIPLQEYQLDHEARTATFKPIPAAAGLLPVKYPLRIPLREVALRLREMRPNEIPVDEESYGAAIETFLGGEGAIRVCGPPVFLDYVTPKDDRFRYFASIGYELPGQPGLLGDESFFLGELALYFFVSDDWNTVRVVPQDSA